MMLLGEASCLEFKALVPTFTYRYKKRHYSLSGSIILEKAEVIYNGTLSSAVDLTAQPWDAAIHHIMEQTYLLYAKLQKHEAKMQESKIKIQESKRNGRKRQDKNQDNDNQVHLGSVTRVYEIIESWEADLIASKKEHILGQIAKMPICTV